MNAQSILFTFWKSFHFHARFKNWAMRLLMNIKETFLANLLMMETHQTLIVERGLSVLNNPIHKGSDENMNSFSNLRSMINILLALFSKGTLSDALEGVTS